MTKRKIQYWVIPPEADGEFVAHMEEVLETYEKAYDPAHPVLCMDEQPVQLLNETRQSLPATKDHAERVDYEYERAGTASIFMFAEPLSGFRQATARPQRTKVDWALEVAALLDTRYSAELTDGKELHGLDWWKEQGLRTNPFSQLDWYLLPTLVEQELRFELPYQERLMRVGAELGARLHEHDMRWWDKQLEEYRALPAWKDFPGVWDDALREQGGEPADFPFWMLTARSMQYAWGGNVGMQMIREVAQNIAGHRGEIVNGATARRLGIADGDEIELATPHRSTRGNAVIREGIRPDRLLAIGQFDHWVTPYAKDFGRGLDDRMNDRFVGMYVNDLTLDYGERGTPFKG